jgi:hypothetical protein
MEIGYNHFFLCMAFPVCQSSCHLMLNNYSLGNTLARHLDLQSDLCADLPVQRLKLPLPKLEAWECEEYKLHSSISER